MNEGKLIRDIQLDSNQYKLIQPLLLLTNKPTLYVVNVGEDEISEEKLNSEVQKLVYFVKKRDNTVILLGFVPILIFQQVESLNELGLEISVLINSSKSF